MGKKSANPAPAPTPTDSADAALAPSPDAGAIVDGVVLNDDGEVVESAAVVPAPDDTAARGGRATTGELSQQEKDRIDREAFAEVTGQRLRPNKKIAEAAAKPGAAAKPTKEAGEAGKGSGAKPKSEPAASPDPDSALETGTDDADSAPAADADEGEETGTEAGNGETVAESEETPEQRLEYAQARRAVMAQAGIERDAIDALPRATVLAMGKKLGDAQRHIARLQRQAESARQRLSQDYADNAEDIFGDGATEEAATDGATPEDRLARLTEGIPEARDRSRVSAFVRENDTRRASAEQRLAKDRMAIALERVQSSFPTLKNGGKEAMNRLAERIDQMDPEMRTLRAGSLNEFFQLVEDAAWIEFGRQSKTAPPAAAARQRQQIDGQPQRPASAAPARSTKAKPSPGDIDRLTLQAVKQFPGNGRDAERRQWIDRQLAKA